MTEDNVPNAISVDVEDYFHVAAFDRAIDRKEWSQIKSRVVENTHKILELFSRYDAKATFFVLGLVAEQFPGLVKDIVEAGHELASHGYSHKKIYSQSERAFREETRRSKRLLEDISGKQVIGYRAASFSVTRESLWALDVLADEGFKYDSSIFPVKHDNYGIPGAAFDPCHLGTPAGGRIAELPMSTIGFGAFRLPIGGGGYFRLYPYWLTKYALQRMNEEGRGFVFYCHPWELDTEQPRIKGASLLSQFRHYNNLKKFESRLERLLKEFTVDTCSSVLRQKGLIKQFTHADVAE